MRIYNNFINLEKGITNNNFKEKLIRVLGETILGYFRCIYREEGYTKQVTGIISVGFKAKGKVLLSEGDFDKLLIFFQGYQVLV